MGASLSRRSLLGAVAAVPAVALPAIVSARATAPVDRAAWDAGMVAYLAAQRAADDHDDRVYTPPYERLKREAPRPELRFEVPNAAGVRRVFDLFPSDLHGLDDHRDAAVREAAARERDAWLRYKALSSKLGVEAAAQEQDRLSDTAADRLADLMPAPDLAALHWKLDYLFGESGGRESGESNDAYCGEWADAFMADVHRLLAGGEA